MEGNKKKEIIKKVAVDVGGTHIRSALIEISPEGKIQVEKIYETETPKDKEKFLDSLIIAIKENFRYNETNSIGISCPGPLNEEIIINPPNIPLKNFKLKKFLEKKFKVPIKIENDANCVALAESRKGLGKKHSISNLVVITLGTGIGGGIVINNELYKGQGFAGEIGHMVLKGKYLEKISSGNYLKKLSKEKLGREMKMADILNLRTKQADEIVEEITENLSQTISTIINLLNPDAVILAGGFKESGNRLLKLINIKIKKHYFMPCKTKITWSKIENPGILGAGLL